MWLQNKQQQQQSKKYFFVKIALQRLLLAYQAANLRQLYLASTKYFKGLWCENSLQPWRTYLNSLKTGSPFWFSLTKDHINLHPGTILFFCCTSRQRTYVTNAITIFRCCLLFSFTESAAKLPFTWQLLMKSEHSCKLVVSCFHFLINCPPAIIKFKLVIVSFFPFSL